MEIRQLQYFLSLVEEGSTTRAARRMNVVQPALSMQIAKLEDELGQKLFERTATGMVPTPVGQEAYRLFVPVMRDIADARHRLARSLGEVTGRVAVGVVASVTSSVLPRALGHFSSSYPRVNVSVSDGYSSDLIEQVRSGALDFAFVNRPRRKLELPAWDVLDEEMLLVSSAKGALSTAQGVHFWQLGEVPLILPSRRHGLRQILERIAEEEGVTLSPRLELDSVHAIEELIRRTGFVTVLPRIAVHPGLSRGELIGQAIALPRVHRQIICVTNPRRVLSEAARLFSELLTDEIRSGLPIS